MSKDLQILQLTADGKSQRMIAKMLSVSRNTISSVQAASARSGKTLPELLQMDEQQLVKVLFPEKELIPVQVKPDFEWIHKELLKDDVTLHSLWEEYCDQCREAKRPPYMYSQFCKLYSDYVDQHRLTMHINHKPGDKLMVDWAGDKFYYYDSDDDKDQPCHCAQNRVVLKIVFSEKEKSPINSAVSFRSPSITAEFSNRWINPK